MTTFADATLSSDPNADVTEYNFDIAGNLVEATLSCRNVKTINYDKANEYAFPISEVKGSSPQLTNSATYNRNTGLVMTSINENGQPTNYEYEPDTLRPKKTIYPNGGYSESFYSVKEQTGANLLPGYVRQKTTLETNKFALGYSYFDGRGQGFRSATQTPDNWLISAMEYDNLGRVRKSYNPFYGSATTTAIPSGTKFTETTAIDALGRTTGVTLQDNTTVSTEFSDTNTTPPGFNKTFVTVTDQAGVKYIHQDIQGSTRCVSGAVISRMDYQAFGEQLPQNIGQRTATGFISNDTLRQRYGLTERDEATGLDDTWWRKQENRAGRWTSPDPYLGSMNPADPQSLNRYSYVENDPINFTDPSGLEMCSAEYSYGQCGEDAGFWG